MPSPISWKSLTFHLLFLLLGLAPLSAEVKINEIMYRPGTSFPEPTAQEYIELYNTEAFPVDLSGWAFTSGVSYTFPAGTALAGHGYLVVAAAPETVAGLYGITGVYGPWQAGAALSNKGEKIELSMPGPTPGSWVEMDQVTYSSEGDWAERAFVSTAAGWEWVTPANTTGLNFTAAAASDTLTATANHGLAVGDPVRFISTGVLPAPLVAGTTYYVRTAGSIAFTLCETVGGPTLDLTDAGTGQHTVFSGVFLRGGGKSLELCNPALSNNEGQNWTASTSPTGGTPGAPNTALTTNLAPIITKVQHFPAIPKSAEDVTVSCQLADESAAADLTATLYWRVSTASPLGFQPVTMTNDGSGTFHAAIPAKANLSIVEFYISATDGTNTRTWPAATNLGQVANCQYQVDNSVDSGDTYYRMVLTTAENAAYNASANSSDEKFNLTIVRSTGTDVEIRYRCSMRTRGNSSRSYTINSVPARPMRLNFPGDDPLDGAYAYDLNVKCAYLQFLGNRLMQAAGLVAPECIPIELRRNGVEQSNTSTATNSTADFGKWVRIEAYNGEFIASHYPDAKGGNLYKKVDDGDDRYWRTVGWTVPSTPDGTLDHWSKESNGSENNWSDLTNFFNVWQTNCAPHFPGAPAGDVSQSTGARLTDEGVWDHTTFTPAEYQAIGQVIDVNQWAKFLAVHTILMDVETKISNGVDDDYSAYFVPGTDGFTRMQLLPHDFDTILGKGETEPAYNSKHAFDATGNGETFRPLLALMANNTFPTSSEFRTLYLNTLRELYGTVFNANTTGNANPPFYAFVDNHLAGWVPTATLSAIKTFATQRQAYLFTLIGGAATAPPAATASATFLSPPAGPLMISEILASNTGAHQNGDTFPDVIELYNADPAPRDLSGMSLSDDPSSPARYVFPEGIAIPANGYLIVYADSAAAPGLHTGFGLAADGDQLGLYDRADHGRLLLDSVVFGPQAANFSIGRTGAARDTWALCTPSIGAANTAATLGAPGGLVINEWLSNPDYRFDDDFVEIYNPAAAPVAMAGMSLTDDFINAPAQFVIPPLSFIGPGRFLAFRGLGDKATPGNALELPFKIDSVSGWLALLGANGTIVDRVDIVTQQPDGSTARTTDGGALTGTRALPAAIPTPGASNGGIPPNVLALYANLRISEVNYAPQGNADLEFLEFTNSGTTPLDLTGVRITNGVDFVFPASILVPGAQVLVVRDAGLVRAFYGNSVNIIGEYSGKLDNAGEKITVQGPEPYEAAIVSFKYDPGWYPTTNTGGFTLELADPTRPGSADGAAANWRASAATGGTPAQTAPPGITSALSDLATLTYAYTYQLAVSNQPFFLSATGLPPGLTFDPVTAQITGTPTATGVYNVALSARNGAGTDSQTLVLRVSTHLPPVITSAATAGSLLGDPFVYQIAAANVPAFFGVTGLPAELSLDPTTGKISGTFSVAGTYNMQISATNDGGTGTLPVTINVSNSGPLAGFTWDPIPAAQIANTPFTVTVRARDAANRPVTSFGGNVSVTAQGPVVSEGIVVITECNTGATEYFEIQNVGNAPLDTTGWFVIPSNASAINSTYTPWMLPNSIAAGEVILVTEATASYNVNINWGTTGSWCMLCDDTGAIRDFVAWVYSRTQLNSINFSTTVGGKTYSNITVPAAAWTGNGIPSAVSTRSVRARIGTGNTHSAADWENRFLSTSSSTPRANPGLQNAASGTSPGLTVPFTPAPVTATVTPSTVTFSAGVWTGDLSIAQGLDGLTLTADDGASHTGQSNSFNVTPLFIPAISSPTSVSVAVNQPFAFQLTATSTVDTWAATGLPVGLTLNPATGIISGTPTLATTTSVGLSATNGSGTGSAALSIVTNSDTDGDGLPNFWEAAYGLLAANAADANGDLDGDGASNLAEYLAGTLPNDRSSIFKIDRQTIAGNDIVLQWTGVATRRYRVWSTSDLKTPWTKLTPNPLPGVAGPMSYTHPGGALNGPRFYRVEVFQ